VISRLTLGAALYSLASCAAERADLNPSHLGCDVAVVYAETFALNVRANKDFETRKLALSTSTDWIVPSQEDLDRLVAENPGSAEEPDYELVAAAARHRDLNVLEQCPSLRKWAERERVVTDEAEIERLTQPEEWAVVIVTMSMPVITPDAQTALVYAAEYAGGLSGATFAVSYARDDKGNWEMIDKSMLAVS
jgi:hypothetical protein